MANGALSREELFVYGSLLQPERRRKLLGRDLELSPARLDGFVRRHGLHFYIVPDPQAHTAGGILGALSARDLALLDDYESVPLLYTRERVRVMASGEEKECWCYFPTARITSDRSDSISLPDSVAPRSKTVIA